MLATLQSCEHIRLKGARRVVVSAASENKAEMKKKLFENVYKMMKGNPEADQW